MPGHISTLRNPCPHALAAEPEKGRRRSAARLATPCKLSSMAGAHLCSKPVRLSLSRLVHSTHQRHERRMCAEHGAHCAPDALAGFHSGRSSRMLPVRGGKALARKPVPLRVGGDARAGNLTSGRGGA